MKLNKIITVPYIEGSDTPARVHRPSGTVFINASVWDNYTKAEQKIILLHEEGHYILQTTSEEYADKYALNKFAGSEPYSLRKIFNLLYNALDLSRIENKQRLITLAKNIAIIDFQKFGNNEAISLLNKIKKMEELIIKRNIRDLPTLLDFSGFEDNMSIEEAVFNAQVQYIQSCGIIDITKLTDQEKVDILNDFFNSEFMQKVILGVAILEGETSEDLESSDFAIAGLLLVPGVKMLLAGAAKSIGISGLLTAVRSYGIKIIGLMSKYGIKILGLAKKYGLKKAIEMLKGGGNTDGGSTPTPRPPVPPRPTPRPPVPPRPTPRPPVPRPDYVDSENGSGESTDVSEKKKILGMSVPVFAGVTAGAVVITGLAIFLIIKFT